MKYLNYIKVISYFNILFMFRIKGKGKRYITLFLETQVMMKICEFIQAALIRCQNKYKEGNNRPLCQNKYKEGNNRPLCQNKYKEGNNRPLSVNLKSLINRTQLQETLAGKTQVCE